MVYNEALSLSDYVVLYIPVDAQRRSTTVPGSRPRCLPAVWQSDGQTRNVYFDFVYIFNASRCDVLQMAKLLKQVQLNAIARQPESIAYNRHEL